VPTKKLKVEIFDAEGNRYTVSCEGKISRDRILRLLDLAELLGGSVEDNKEWRSTSGDYSKFDKMCALVKQVFPFGWFSSKDAKKVCGQELGEHLSLSTVSTYLSRMADRGFLMRKGPLNNRRYKILRIPYDGETNILKDK
jgi:hypothetical protein